MWESKRELKRLAPCDPLTECRTHDFRTLSMVDGLSLIHLSHYTFRKALLCDSWAILPQY